MKNKDPKVTVKITSSKSWSNELQKIPSKTSIVVTGNQEGGNGLSDIETIRIMRPLYRKMNANDSDEFHTTSHLQNIDLFSYLSDPMARNYFEGQMHALSTVVSS